MSTQAVNITVERIISYSILSGKPKLFSELTGITINEFDQLFAEFETAWGTTEVARLKQRSSRIRAIGGGRKYKLPLEDRLLAIMVWLHKQLRPGAVAILFNVHISTAIRNRNRIVEALQKIDTNIVNLHEFPAAGQGSSIEDHPELLELMNQQQPAHNHTNKVITLQSHHHKVSEDRTK